MKINIKRSTLAIATLSAIAITTLTGCVNKIPGKLTWKMDRAMVKLPDGSVVTGPVETWADFNDNDQVQVKINGVIYVCHSSNVCFMVGEERDSQNGV